MIVALGDKPARHPRAASSQVKGSTHTAPARASTSPRPHKVRAHPIASSAESAPANPPPPALAPDQYLEAADRAALAQALVDAGATTKPVAVVASILYAHAEGTALNRIATDVGVHHKTVSKIIDAAEKHQRYPVAV